MNKNILIFFVILIIFFLGSVLFMQYQTPLASTLSSTDLPKSSTVTAKPATDIPQIALSATNLPQPTITLVPDPVLVGAGDIARCGSDGDEATGALIEGISGTVFTAGDNVYDNGTKNEFIECYDPSWGKFKDRTRPSPGNHDYMTKDAKAYYEYFGAAAGDPSKGYYSYNLGTWHIIVLNSNIDVTPGSKQELWLRQDLIGHPSTCTLAYWHDPLFSSGSVHGGSPYIRPLWQALYDFHADVVVNGHEHNYEQFALQSPPGEADSTGIRQFVVGTGGGRLYDFGGIAENSEVRYNKDYGVLKLTLHPTGYDWEFIPVEGSTFSDSGTGQCIE